MRDIASRDWQAIFLLDSVYVGILEQDASVPMFREILEDAALMRRIVFLESLSKTLGTTGLRIGWIWTADESLSLEIKKNVILKKA